MNLNKYETNAKDAVEYLLSVNNIKVSSIGLEEELLLHPDFPSVASVSDALNEWKIPNLATRIPIHQLTAIPLPALFYLTVRDGILAPIKTIKNDTIEWLDTENGWQKETIDSFEHKWDGTALLIEPNEFSGELKYKTQVEKQLLKNARIFFLAAGSILCLGIFAFLNLNILLGLTPYLGFIIFVKFVGTALCALLLWSSLNSDNPFLHKLCHFSSQSNCSDILQSKAAKITSWLTWADLGFIYFAGGIITMLFAIINGNQVLLTWLGILSVVALPYTFYSIGYQYFVAKRWCPLCLSVQFILWIEFLIFVFQLNIPQIEWDARSLLLLSIAFLIPSLLWTFLKEPLIRSYQWFDLQRQFYKVKFNDDFIRATFSQNDDMPPIFDDMHTVKMGRHDSKNLLTIITNPMCSPCSQMHSQINELISDGADIQCEFIFIGNRNAWRVAEVFLASSESETKHKMSDWFRDINQDVEKWRDLNYSATQNGEAIHQLRLHGKWSAMAGVTATPTVYFNKAKFPSVFQIKDLKKVVRSISANDRVPIIS
ncbi:vitamin K epoxide reductase family protein [Dyadobacter sp. CY343]|uniref:vitamin K epoxide reductase family protein n=1 Tax=Dyadobacter sp. CY343 TaxID=2907299 RepID=UPI001F4916E1|nr:vitamin K epoxide reductase family protein [Dyadobacter sp. CY343]MCE7063214.1 vitamin K epoxide reductase family protein [Dyadobacter sp. CY343]